MHITQQELESWYSDLSKAYELCCQPQRTRIRDLINPVWASIGQKLREKPRDLIDVVPVLDYPFPWLGA